MVDWDEIGVGNILVAIIMTVVILVLILGSGEIIDAGDKGVITSSPSGPSDQEINEGWNFKLKFLASRIEHVEYRTQTVNFIGSDASNDDVGSISVASKDNILVYLDFSIIYHIQEDKVADLVIQNGVNYRERIIVPTARSIPRDVCVNYNAMELRGQHRPLIEKAISENITARLLEKWIVVEDFALRDIRVPDSLERAIEAKKVAEQNVLTQQYNLDAEKYVANKMIVQMNATAAAIVINATAWANATIIRAVGQAEAIAKIMEAMNSTTDNRTKEYLQWVYLQMLSDPNTKVQYIIIPSEGGIPILLDVTQPT